MTITRIPMFFGPEARSLFGWYHAPAGGATSAIAMVLCPALGHEYVNAHRSLRHLADRLAEAGIPAFRFDYDGTGDSAGRDDDPERWERWRDSIVEAMNLVEQRSGCPVGLLGLRLGAILAATVASEREVPCLVLWAPVIEGKAWLREMKALHRMGASRGEGTESGYIEPGGFPITPQTQRDVSRVSLLELNVPKSSRALIISRDDLADDRRLRERWLAAGIMAEERALPGYQEMMLAPHNTVLPEAVLTEIAGWVSGIAQADQPESVPQQRSPAEPRITQLVQGPEGVVVRETIHPLGREGRIFAILSEPVAASHNAPSILLPNAGSSHHIGPNRLYLQLARALSGAGFRCIRIDLPGLGDSFVESVEEENDAYPPRAIPLLGEILEEMRRGDDRDDPGFVVAGLCSGAHTAFHAAVELSDSKIVESILINPLTFYYRRGMSLDQPQTPERVAVEHVEAWQWYMRSLRSREGWRKLLQLNVRVDRIAGAVYHRVVDRLSRRLTTIGEVLRGNAEPEPSVLERDIQRAADAGTRLTFLFASFDPGYELLFSGAGRTLARLIRRDKVRVWVVDGADHTFEAGKGRAAMLKSLLAHLSSRYLR